MTDNPVQGRWYKITVGRAIIATLWMGVSFFAYAFANQWHGRKPSDPVFFLLIAAAVLSPFVAVGTIVGRPVRGLFFGIASVIVYMIGTYMAIDHGWMSFP